MKLKTILSGSTFEFDSVKEVLAKANEEKSGDELAGIAAANAQERVAAKVVLSELTLENIYENPVIPYEEDEVTRVIYDQVNKTIYNEIKHWTIGELREYLLKDSTGNLEIKRISSALTSEMVAGVTKLMSNMDLVLIPQKIEVVKTCHTTIGHKGTFSARLQPNHPTDNIEGIMTSIMEGVSMGSGDAVIGINPNVDTAESVSAILTEVDSFVRKWEIPTQYTVLSHISTQIEAAKKGAPVNLMFQSIAGTEKGNTSFGIDADLLEEGRQVSLELGTAAGPNVMYFETGQGSELSSDAHHGVDQVTLESRCYGFAKKFDPFLVNTVVGFIGPEYLYDSKQVIRAGLEDQFMGKLQGVSMGVDVCYTNHMKADQNDAEILLTLLGTADINFVMSIPSGDDVMLNYQTTGYHDVAATRQIFNKRPIKEFDEWMEKMGLSKDGKLTEKAGDGSIFMTR